MNGIWQTLVHTPWWVYLLLIFLIRVGIRASKTHVVSLKKLFIVPIIFTFMSIHTLFTSFTVGALTITTWAVAILIGMALGWIQVHRYSLQVDMKNLLIQVPGTWSTLIIILIIFIAKYYFSYELSVDPQLAQQTIFEICALAISGIFTGLFIGRLICYLYRLKTSESVTLQPEKSSKK